MRPLPRCFQCGDSVLDLRGQDIVRPTYFLDPEPSRPDQEVLDAGAYGYVHLRCFVGSRWAGVWAERTRENLEGVRHFPVVFESDDLVLLRHEVLSTRDTIAIGRNGYFSSFGDADIRARRPTPGGGLIPVRHEFNLEVRAGERSRRRSSGPWERGGRPRCWASSRASASATGSGARSRSPTAASSPDLASKWTTAAATFG